MTLNSQNASVVTKALVVETETTWFEAEAVASETEAEAVYLETEAHTVAMAYILSCSL